MQKSKTESHKSCLLVKMAESLPGISTLHRWSKPPPPPPLHPYLHNCINVILYKNCTL